MTPEEKEQIKAAYDRRVKSAKRALDDAFEKAKQLGLRVKMEFGAAMKEISSICTNDFKFADEDEQVQAIIATQCPGYETVEDPGDDHENIRIVFLVPVDESSGLKPKTVAVSVKQFKVIGEQQV
ncbi:MAG: hypothetical protein ACXADB_05930 [Candidatus Hermodarchaeia archaeon]|jgi:hypothetical protein